MHGLMQDKVVVVTGGGSGIGAASAKVLAEQGAQVVIGYHRNVEGAEAVCASLAGGNHFCVQLIINDAESISKAVADISSRVGHVDVLVNSAGSTKPIAASDLDALTDDVFDNITQINLRSAFSVIRAFRPLLDQGSDAAIINIGSLAGRTGVGSNLAYSASKGGLHTLTMGLARVLSPKIRVFTVSPGGVDTQFVKSRDPAKMVHNATVTPLKKVTSPESVAESVLACAALMNSSTGIEIIVDEGRHLIGWPL
jgi:3-oxoacyl-[acyl-carrier protein] reductase